MNTYTTTIVMESADRIKPGFWNRCISDAVERYRAETGQDVRSVRFCVKEETNESTNLSER